MESGRLRFHWTNRPSRLISKREVLGFGVVFSFAEESAPHLYLTLDLNQDGRAEVDELRFKSKPHCEGNFLYRPTKTAFFHTNTNCSCLDKDNCFDTYLYRISLFEFETGNVLTIPEIQKFNVGPDCGVTFTLGRKATLPDQIFTMKVEDLGIKMENSRGVTQFIAASSSLGKVAVVCLALRAIRVILDLKGIQEKEDPKGIAASKDCRVSPEKRRSRTESLQGLQGERERSEIGPRGLQGEPGEKEIPAPEVCKVCKGEPERKGMPDREASKDYKGNLGEKGDTGPQGLQGEPGEKGDTGPRGLQGLQGEPGEKVTPDLRDCKVSLEKKVTPDPQGLQGEPGEKATLTSRSPR